MNKKFKNILAKTEGFKIIEQIYNILEGIDGSMKRIIEDLQIIDLQ